MRAKQAFGLPVPERTLFENLVVTAIPSVSLAGPGDVKSFPVSGGLVAPMIIMMDTIISDNLGHRMSTGQRVEPQRQNQRKRGR